MSVHENADSNGHLEVIAARVRDERKHKALTQGDLASRAGLSLSFISMLERAERSPSYETICALAKGLEIPVAHLVGGSSAEPTGDYGPYRRLVDWACQTHLSRSQVERLIVVGRAMFNTPSRPAATASRTPATAKGLCTSSGCQKDVFAKGLCVAHYREKLRARAQ